MRNQSSASLTILPHFPEFNSRAPWWGADLQTLRNRIRMANETLDVLPQRTVHLSMSDDTGDVLVGRLAESSVTGPDNAIMKPMVVLIHGLSGCEDSAYMINSARFWLARGHHVLRLNLRGAGPSRETCRMQYHAGRSIDLRDALSALDQHWLSAGLIIIGYSLGGNMLLKFLAEFGTQFPIRAAASVSAPIDLAATSVKFLQRRNYFYHQHLLGAMKLECYGGKAEVSTAESVNIAAAKTISEFDDLFVAPRNGFRNAMHYYDVNHARRYLDDIKTPTLIVHSLDDPWIPAESYTSFNWLNNPNLVPLLSPGGGHLGFHHRDIKSPWYDHCIGMFVENYCC